MAKARQFQIHWTDYLVEHFSSFFARQWDECIDRAFADQSLPELALSYTTAALQEVVDCAAVSAKQALSTGFTPSLNYSRVLDPPPQPRYPPQCRQAIRAAVQAILDSDRRERSKRIGMVSLGDYFYEGLRRVLLTSIPEDSLDDHHSAACYFGPSGYHGMLACGVSPDLLLVNYVAQGRRYAVSAATVSTFADHVAAADGVELKKLRIAAENEAEPGSLRDIAFVDCEFAQGAVAVGEDLVLQQCLIDERAFRQCIHSQFKDCIRKKAPPNPMLQSNPEAENAPPEAFHACVFEGGFFVSGQAAIQLHDCYFSPPQLEQIDIDRLSGDYSPLAINACDIAVISPGSRLGQLSNTRVGDADQVRFDDSLTDVRFSGFIDRCVFGGERHSTMRRVRFGPDKTAVAASPASESQACRVSNCVFTKTVGFDQLTFDCRLEDPVFDGVARGIHTIRELVLSRKLRQTFQAVNFGTITSNGGGGLSTLVGGRIFKLDGHIDLLSHTLVRCIGERGRVRKYEVVADPSLRQEWQIKSGPILIGRVQGQIDELALMGDAREGFMIGAVSGTINSLQPAVRVQQLLEGGVVIFARGSDVEKALSEQCIATFSGGRFGVWEQHDGKEALCYYSNQQDYLQRGDIDDVVKGIFDDLG